MSADNVLATYWNWRDTSEWPMSDRVNRDIVQRIKKQADPLEKAGIVGVFCRTYNIHEAIAEFLPDVYEACGMENRYTYVLGSTSAGLVVYDDLFTFSHHSTDPTSGQLCNAFDLVRIHKFGELDVNVDKKTNITKYPSYLAMEELAANDRNVASAMSREKVAAAGEEFAGIVGDGDDSWLEQMDVDKRGVFRGQPTITSISLCVTT